MAEAKNYPCLCLLQPRQKKYHDRNVEEAIKDFNQAIELKPDDAEIYKFRAKAKFDFGDYIGALEDGNQSTKINPDDAETYITRGDAKGRLGDNAGKIDDYSHAVQLKPNAYTYNQLGLIKDTVGDLAGQ